MSAAAPRAVGSLLVVGTGIAAIGHVTLEARRAIEGADEVLHWVPDPLTAEWIEGLNPASRSLKDLYEPAAARAQIYRAMAEEIMRGVRGGGRVCAVFYGHPGVLVHAGRIAMATARDEGHRVRMLPGISAEDCLVADLGVDPGDDGCQGCEATDFLLRPRSFDVATPLVLWQIGAIGVFGWPPSRAAARAGLRVLGEVLGESYGLEHPVTVYEASLLGICDPRRESVPLRDLEGVEVSSASTLYVPPRQAAVVSAERARRLGLDPETVRAALERPR